jgi:hypothetical protein
VERAIRRGPAAARVEGVQADTEEASGAYSRFDII